jgi:hypothetical protein
VKEFLELLQKGTRKKVPLAELRQHYFSLYPDVQNSPDRGARLLDALERLEAAGALSLPAIGSWEKSGVPPLPQWVLLKRELKTPERSGLAGTAWAPELGFWPELRPSQLTTLLPINDFLLRRRGSFMMIPIKERSLEIYGDEKRLDDLCTGDTLCGGRLHLKTIGCFRVPQPLPYRLAQAPGRPVLVVENHNTFWSFGEWNQTAKRYSAVVFGEGQNFRLTGRALKQVMVEVQAPMAEYFGDLDPKGVAIPVDFNRNVEPNYPTVAAALPLYRWLIQNGVRRLKPECKTHDTAVVRAFLGDISLDVVALWLRGEWLPQEALGTEQLPLLNSIDLR